MHYKVRFGAPLFTEPRITADLAGKAAQDSPQTRALRNKVRALAQGDLSGLRKVSTPGAYARTKALLTSAGGEAQDYVKNATTELEKQLSRVQRVVARGDHAVVILSAREWITLVRQGGEWRSDD